MIQTNKIFRKINGILMAFDQGTCTYYFFKIHSFGMTEIYQCDCILLWKLKCIILLRLNCIGHSGLLNEIEILHYVII